MYSIFSGEEGRCLRTRFFFLFYISFGPSNTRVLSPARVTQKDSPPWLRLSLFLSEASVGDFDFLVSEYTAVAFRYGRSLLRTSSLLCYEEIVCWRLCPRNTLTLGACVYVCVMVVPTLQLLFVIFPLALHPEIPGPWSHSAEP